MDATGYGMMDGLACVDFFACCIKVCVLCDINKSVRKRGTVFDTGNARWPSYWRFEIVFVYVFVHKGIVLEIVMTSSELSALKDYR